MDSVPQAAEATSWDQLQAPETLDDLVMLIEDHKDCNMFHGVVGPPFAYFEIPSEDGVLRVTYTVIGFVVQGKPNSAEKQLCKCMWDVFVRIRKQMDTIYPNVKPVLFWRKVPEIIRKGVATAIYFRCAVPGVDLNRLYPGHDHERDGFMELKS